MFKKICAKRLSIFHASFFEKTSLKCHQILYIGYTWLANVPANSITTLKEYSSKTIAGYLKYSNLLATDNVNEEGCGIGGDNIITKIDECEIA